MPPIKGLNCSFCMKGQRDVEKLIAGPSVYICNECVQLCAAIGCEEGFLAFDRLVGAARELPLTNFLTGGAEGITLGDFLHSLSSPKARHALLTAKLGAVQTRKEDIKEQKQRLTREDALVIEEEVRLRRRLDELGTVT